MTTKRPVRVRCAVQGCQQEKYLHQMATVPVWEVRSAYDFTASRERVTWCESCERRRASKLNTELRAEIAKLRDAFYASRDDGKRRVCRVCKEERPESTFLVKNRDHGTEASRMTMCVRCQYTEVQRAKRGTGVKSVRLFDGIPPYDRALQIVQDRLSKPIEHWGRQEHNVHCILMREFAGLSQGRAAFVQGHQARESEDFLEQERVKWDRIVTNVYGWAGLPLPERLQVQAP